MRRFSSLPYGVPPAPTALQPAALPPAGIGHNDGPPLDGGPSWELTCWRKARETAWKNPPIEVVRMRCRQADRLGLTYRQLTAMLMNGAQVPDTGLFPAALLGDPALTGKLAALPSLRVVAYARAPRPAAPPEPAIGRPLLAWLPLPEAADEAARLLREALPAAGVAIRASFMVCLKRVDRTAAERAGLGGALWAADYAPGG